MSRADRFSAGRLPPSAPGSLGYLMQVDEDLEARRLASDMLGRSRCSPRLALATLATGLLLLVSIAWLGRLAPRDGVRGPFSAISIQPREAIGLTATQLCASSDASIRIISALHNNLGRTNDKSAEEGIMLKAELVNCEKSHSVTPCLVSINATSPYAPHAAKENGLVRASRVSNSASASSGEKECISDFCKAREHFININLEAETSVHLEIAFLDPDTFKALDLHAVNMTVYNEKPCDKFGSSVEYLKANRFSEFQLSERIRAPQKDTFTGHTTFPLFRICGRADRRRTDGNATRLEEERNDAVTLRYKDVELPIPITLGSKAGTSPRYFRIALYDAFQTPPPPPPPLADAGCGSWGQCHLAAIIGVLVACVALGGLLILLNINGAQGARGVVALTASAGRGAQEAAASMADLLRRAAPRAEAATELRRAAPPEAAPAGGSDAKDAAPAGQSRFAILWESLEEAGSDFAIWWRSFEEDAAPSETAPLGREAGPRGSPGDARGLRWGLTGSAGRGGPHRAGESEPASGEFLDGALLGEHQVAEEPKVKPMSRTGWSRAGRSDDKAVQGQASKPTSGGKPQQEAPKKEAPKKEAPKKEAPKPQQAPAEPDAKPDATEVESEAAPTLQPPAGKGRQLICGVMC